MLHSSPVAQCSMPTALASHSGTTCEANAVGTRHRTLLFSTWSSSLWETMILLSLFHRSILTLWVFSTQITLTNEWGSYSGVFRVCERGSGDESTPVESRGKDQVGVW